MKSFTLIELLVVISIISILSIFIVPNFHLANSQMALQRSAYKLARDIRSAEEMSMSSKPFKSQYFPSGGYGISFKNSTSSYILFADCNGSIEYDIGDPADPSLTCSNSKDASPRAYPEIVEEFFLESGVEITSSNPLSFEMTFFPPDPTIKSKPPIMSEASVELSSQGKSMNVTVNKVGVIEID